jgi:methylated-DNA-[protein]-cysteine S-methyltransferase
VPAECVLSIDQLPTPLGTTLLVSDAAGVLRALDFADHETRMLRLLRLHYGAVTLQPGRAPPQVREALARYFAGELTALREISWHTAGTQFQRTVWRALTHIAAGTTTTYGTLARTLGVPNAARAVGLANGSNPVSIVVPCHRVIGADGKLTGYGGGLHRKQWLLCHEGARLS